VFQTFCSLLLHPVLGLPFARQTLAKSARSDDLISGTDFLSVFIGASIPRSRADNRSRSFDRHVESVTSEESNAEQTTVFASLTSPKESISLASEAFGDSSSILPINFHVATEGDKVGEISTGYADLSTTEALETHTLNNEAQESPLPNSSSDGAKTKILDAESVLVNSKGSESTPKSSSKRVVNSPHDKERDESKISFTPPSKVVAFSDRTKSVTFGMEDMFAFPRNDSVFSHKETETNSKYSEISKVPVENETFSANPASSKGNKTASLSSLQTTEENGTENQTHKVVSVRVSSSVALGTAQDSRYDRTNRRPFNNFLESFSHDTVRGAHGPSAGSISLVTEEQPAATAIQRRQFSVEEASPSSSIVSVHQESSSSNVQSQHSAFPFPRQTESPINPQSSPVSYHTSVSTATSGSRVQFYSEPPSYQKPASVAETVQRRVVAQQPQRQSYGQMTSVLKTAGDSGRKMKSNYQTSSSQDTANIDGQNAGRQFQQETNRPRMGYGAHQEPSERNYETPEQNHGAPEKNYATPEKNYEVDEAVSVMTNGRAHGIQLPAVTTPADSTLREFSAQHEQSQDPNSKFGYVVEGRNFRKYQVEERTPDGFIVGEYGVVSHDDGSLRGVRYTADGTINPRLIYDALVKFLSL
jgi:hypothetical protein